ncbi:MAG TPA: acylneuraminate cytidylyltransferase family protein [Acidimicrobiales bacterium]|nr:acylneuraminate cytidylyltransferase family protein [Acidimicrobiales bacterium]
MEVLAVIPARGGSKGIPRKNVVELLGRPLLWWSVRAALDAETVTRTVLSTDDAQIAEIGASAGAEVPFLRPAELAGDEVLDLPVFLHVLQALADAEGYRPDLVVHLRPTSPLRPPGLVDDGVRTLAADPAADSLRAVTVPANNPFKMWRIEGGVLVPLVDSGIPEQYNQPRQALPDAYWQTGTLDVVRTATLVEQRSMTGRRILPMVIDPELAVDIDDPVSLAVAEDRCRRFGLGKS